MSQQLVKININNPPFEILEHIFMYIYNGILRRRKNLNNFSLVSKHWREIALSVLWRELRLSGDYSSGKSHSFSMYRIITSPNFKFGPYIKYLNLDSTTFWPICILKLIKVCPNITDFSLTGYKHSGSKGNVNDLLGEILKNLPNLVKINIRFSEQYFSNTVINRLIETRKDLFIQATRKSVECPGLIDIYQS
jgi:hypothetical protein